MNEQQRQEVSELILRALRLQYEVGSIDTSAGTPIHAVLAAQENAYTAQRELWEALYRIRIED